MIHKDFQFAFHVHFYIQVIFIVLQGENMSHSKAIQQA